LVLLQPMLMPCALDAAGFLATLVVATAANDGSLSLQRYSAGLDFLSQHAEHGKEEEQMWPALSSEASSRGLAASTPCWTWLVEKQEAAAFTKLRTCIKQKETTTDMRVAGSRFAINHGCWCETGMEQVLDVYDCASSPVYGLYFKANCTPTCSAPAAQQCIQDCPASCLETDYAPEFCSTAFDNCVPHLACITEHSKNMTLAGHQDHPFQCDDTKFFGTSQWRAWKECFRKLPKRTHWHRHNAENHCDCEANLKAAAKLHTCCDSKWGKPICDEQCAAAANINCLSTEATQCMATCNDVCRTLLVGHTPLSAACQQQCFDSTSTCAKYSVCPPAGDVQFDYVCDNGQPPMANGCCGSSSNMHCPSQCTHSTGFIWAVFTTGHECQCLGCPSSLVAAKAKLAAQLTNDMDAHGIQALASISKQVGILGANRKMQELMNTRNAAIQSAFQDHPGNIDDAWNAKAAQIIAEYRALIVAEAEAFKVRGEVDDVPGRGGKGAATAKKGGEDSDSTPIIIGVVCGAVGLCLCAASLLLYRRGKAANASANAGNVGPNDGDTNVVMGRPVQSGDTSNTAQGAPVSREAEKGSTEPEKPTAAM